MIDGIDDAACEEVAGGHLIARIRQLVAEGNARAVRVRSEDGKIFLEIPLIASAVTGGVVILAAPWLAILAALTALVANVKLEVVPSESTTGPDSAAQAAKPSAQT